MEAKARSREQTRIKNLKYRLNLTEDKKKTQADKKRKREQTDIGRELSRKRQAKRRELMTDDMKEEMKKKDAGRSRKKEKTGEQYTSAAARKRLCTSKWSDERKVIEKEKQKQQLGSWRQTGPVYGACG